MRYLDFFGGETQADTLGSALGFALADDFTAQPLRYRDPAEAALWNGLLDVLAAFGLIVRSDDGLIRRTAYSAAAIQYRVKYEYFIADCAYWQLNELEVSDDFSFISLGLTPRLNNQLPLDHPGCQAELPASAIHPSIATAGSVLSTVRHQLNAAGIEYDTEILDVDDSRSNGYPTTRTVLLTGYCYRLAAAPSGEDAPDYRFTADVAGQANPDLTAVLNQPAHAAVRVAWGHQAEFAAFQANPAASIDATALHRFASDWHWPTLLADSRLRWAAPETLPALLRGLPPPQRNQLSTHVPLQLLEAELDSYPSLWDWAVLSGRLSEEFITERLIRPDSDGTPLYPWDFEVLSRRSPAAVENWLGQMLRSPWADQLSRSESFQWDWTALTDHLSESFILAHLGLLPFSRSLLLRRGPAFLEAALLAEIAAGQLGYWDWSAVFNGLSTQLLWDQLPNLAAHLPWHFVLERLLGPGQSAPTGFDLPQLLDLVRKHRNSINPLTTQNLAWSSDLIAFFDSLGLLHWASSATKSGFECHSAVAWTTEHFERYYQRVRTAEGAAHVSANISSLDLVTQYPDFTWDWTALSSNPQLAWTRDLTARFRDRIVWSRLLARFGATEVARRLPDLHTQLLEARPDALPDLWRYANQTLPVPVLLSWRSTYAQYLDLAVLSRRDPVAVANELLIHPDFGLAWDWAALVADLPPDLLANLLREAEIYYHHDPASQLASLSLPAAARLPLNFSLTIAPSLQLPWDWEYVTQQLTPDQLNTNLGQVAFKINWGLIVIQPPMQPLLTSSWVLDSSAQPWLPWPQVSRLLTPEQVEAHLETLAPFLDWVHLAHQPGFASLVVSQLLDHPVVRGQLPWDYVLEKLIAPSDLAENLSRWQQRLLSLTNPATQANACAAFTRSLPVEVVISDPNAATQAYPALTNGQLRALPLDWQVLSDDSRLAHRLTVGTLRRYQHFWHWPTLSRNPEFNADPDYLLNKDLKWHWDWSYISQYAAFIRPYTKFDKVRKQYKRFARFIDWKTFSLRLDLPFLGELLQAYADRPWNWTALSASPALSLADEHLLGSPDKPGLQNQPWDWTALSANRGLKIQLTTIKALADQPWDWTALSANLSVKFDHSTLLHLAEQPWDWAALVRRTDLKWNSQILRDFLGYSLDWAYLSNLRSLDWSVDLLREFQDYLDWHILSRNPPFSLTVPLLRELASKWDLAALSRSLALADPPASSDPAHRPAAPSALLIPTADLPWDWPYLSSRTDISFTTELLEGLTERLHWPTLSRRSWAKHFEPDWVQRFNTFWDFPALAVHADLPDAGQKEVYAFIAADKSCVLPYLHSLEKYAPKYPSWAGYAFHCTHLTNAASIILSGQLLSRREVLKTKHNLADASGSINHWPAKVWDYARLYYRPHTLTQFYVERLGLDRSWLNDEGYDFKEAKKRREHFGRAEGLGFPKCPAPVYFRFRIAEILATQPERFHISDGNMQGRATTHDTLKNMWGLFRPHPLLFHRLGIDGRFKNPFDEFKEISQQEILLKPSLDITKLTDVDILVSDYWTYDELKKLIGSNHPLASRIRFANSEFHDENQQLWCSYSDNQVSVETEFADAHDIVLECADLLQADLSEMEPGTYRVIGNRLLAQQRLYVSWPTAVPFRVFFQDKVTSRPGGPRSYALFQNGITA
ncbi:DarT ssDNA thymidine ADP-ribosyltransferase family protein [Hymenobacter wooponensis]|uniref:DarT ssDNA thymidine ADP-ribosyltransferase family protein n=1 Tax=Hymenobacter wooponensis TaxID=1525360 RepID=UPI001AEBD575|nr:DarT ssDNA thymidine ADP-ribosyltransferase family protein [Hymenobacter wooponensis]